MGPALITLPSHGPGTPGSPRRRRWRPIALAAWCATVLAVLAGRALQRVEVSGRSMAPTFLPGDRLVVLRRPLGTTPWPEVGAVVAVRDPRERTRTLVKRVARVDRAAGTLEVVGDDPAASTDSREFGPVPLDSVVGRIVYRYGPTGRTGPGPWPRDYDQP